MREARLRNPYRPGFGAAIVVAFLLAASCRREGAPEALAAAATPAARVRYHAKDCSAAWMAVSPFESTTRSVETLSAMALIQTCRGRRTESIALLRRSLEIDPAQAGPREALRLLEGGKPAAR